MEQIQLNLTEDELLTEDALEYVLLGIKAKHPEINLPDREQVETILRRNGKGKTLVLSWEIKKSWGKTEQEKDKTPVVHWCGATHEDLGEFYAATSWDRVTCTICLLAKQPLRE
jgi:hypothetical protein